MNFTCCAYDVSVLCVLQAVQSLEINIQTLLHTDAFTHRRFYTDAFTHRYFCTQTLLHKHAFTHRRYYTETLLHRDAFTSQTLLHTDAFTHRSFDTRTQKLCTHRKKTAILPQFLVTDLHFVRKGCNGNTEIAI